MSPAVHRGGGGNGGGGVPDERSILLEAMEAPVTAGVELTLLLVFFLIHKYNLGGADIGVTYASTTAGDGVWKNRKRITREQLTTC